MSQALDIASRLKAEADDLLYKRGIDALLRQYGEVTYAGSYAADLMAWPDIDLNLVVRDELDPRSVASELAVAFIKMPEAARVKFETGLHERRPGMPEGIYLAAKLRLGDWKSAWKLDIWIVDEAETAKTVAKNEWLLSQLDAEKRSAILEWKQRIMTPEGRTPSFSGWWLYQALLTHGYTREEDVLGYMRQHGIAV